MVVETGVLETPQGTKGRRRRQRRGRRAQRARGGPRLAVIDLGTNNCRLLIAEPTGRGGFRILDSFSRIVRLGEGVAKSGALAEGAVERTLEALRVCAERIARWNATHVRAIATEACRRARNAERLLIRAREETGIALSIVSAEEEARLAAIGCAPLIGARFDGALIFDIGGGSTEIVWLRGNAASAQTAFSASVPIGVVNLAEVGGHAANREAYRAMCKDMFARFAEVRARMDRAGTFDPHTHHLLGTSGTVTTLAGIALGLRRYNRSRVDATWHNTRDMFVVIDRIVALSVAERAGIGCVGPERADLIAPGCAIFDAICAHWPCDQIRVADRGLREGMLRELLAEAMA